MRLDAIGWRMNVIDAGSVGQGIKPKFLVVEEGEGGGLKAFHGPEYTQLKEDIGKLQKDNGHQALCVSIDRQVKY